MKAIHSRDNPVVKRARRLLAARGRREEGCFLLEGLRLVREALAAGAQVEAFFATADFLAAHPEAEEWAAGVPAYLVGEPVMKSLSATESPPGILAICRCPRWELDRAVAPHSLLLVLDNVRDPGNAGTMLRTAWAAGVEAVLLTTGTVDAFSPKVVRASMGAVLHLPLFERAGEPLLAALGERGCRFLVADARGQRLYSQADYQGLVAVVMGSEATGPGPFFARAGAERVRIPLRAGVDSLNAAVACGIILYEAWEQRNGR
ncbi:MAG: RNA methyltransferase [Syntrophomonadaceae bacterium]|jgi:TrmH family RNA methyltransferase|nr:RNA methyltransferase [Syntrophomonadaceae bacterium]MDH7498059.1 RNA methyltransferase [Syntrophomonadaceae bacterium]